MGATQSQPETGDPNVTVQMLKEENKNQTLKLTIMRQEKRKQDILIEAQLKTLENQIKELKLANSQTIIRLKDQDTQTDESCICFCEGNAAIDGLLSRTPDIPKSPTGTCEWFSNFIIRASEAEPDGNPSSAVIDACSWLYDGVYALTPFVDNKLNEVLNDGDKIVYHGTDSQRAQSILENGIDLTKSSRNMDFSCGKGFYVTDNFYRAVLWSERIVKSSKGIRTVIAFKMNTSLQAEQPSLSLNVGNLADKRVWERVVTHFRAGGIYPDLKFKLNDVKFITGPVAKNKSLQEGEIPVPYEFTQICICDDDYAKRFGSLQNICFVMFFS